MARSLLLLVSQIFFVVMEDCWMQTWIFRSGSCQNSWKALDLLGWRCPLCERPTWAAVASNECVLHKALVRRLKLLLPASPILSGLAEGAAALPKWLLWHPEGTSYRWQQLLTRSWRIIPFLRETTSQQGFSTLCWLLICQRRYLLCQAVRSTQVFESSGAEIHHSRLLSPHSLPSCCHSALHYLTFWVSVGQWTVGPVLQLVQQKLMLG